MTKNLIDYEMLFTDRTIIEGNGEYDKVCQIMTGEGQSKDWMLETNLQMMIKMPDRLLDAMFKLHFYENGMVYIVEYSPSDGVLSFYSPDIRGLMSWALQNGWKFLRPSNDLVRDDMFFWKNCWETNLVESEYLEDQYGKKDNLP